jgi:hypothetical protein
MQRFGRVRGQRKEIGMRYLALAALLGFCLAITVGCESTPPKPPVDKKAPEKVPGTEEKKPAPEEKKPAEEKPATEKAKDEK